MSLRRIGRIGPSRSRSGMRAIKAIEPMQGTLDSDPDEDLERRFAGWVQRVGEARAEEARQVYLQRPYGQKAANRTSLPNLLAEAWAMRSGHRYAIEVDLGWARPDLVVFIPAGAVVIRVQGDYWHSRAGAVVKDEAQRALLEGNTIEGRPIMRVFDAWERDVYEGDAVLQRALEGLL